MCLTFANLDRQFHVSQLQTMLHVQLSLIRYNYPLSLKYHLVVHTRVIGSPGSLESTILRSTVSYKDCCVCVCVFVCVCVCVSVCEGAQIAPRRSHSVANGLKVAFESGEHFESGTLSGSWGRKASAPPRLPVMNDAGSPVPKAEPPVPKA